MNIPGLAVRQRVSVIVLSLVIAIFGIYSYLVLPRESEPDITIPYVFVSTDYRGVSPSDIETSITTPIEKKLKGMDGIKKMQSISSEGLSSISIEFNTDVDIDDALQKVRNKVDEAELPGDIENDPSVFEVNFSELPIVVYSLYGTCGQVCLKDIADQLEEQIEAIPGVLDVEIAGGLEREIKIIVDPQKLAYYGIPITSFESVVSSENQNTSGGTITLGDGRYTLSVPGEFKSPAELYGLVVGLHEGQPVYLKDVALVSEGFKEQISRSRLNGKEAVSLAVKKRSGQNIIKISEKIDALIDGLKPSWPEGTEIAKMMDKAKNIRLMVEDLENNILTGLVLVVLVLMFAMGIRNSIIVSLAIPFSMFISFAVIHSLGYTLNMVVLYALILALGMLVDNAIVIVENIYRYMQQGVPKIEAAKRATSEVAMAVTSSTATTLAAFLPLIYWPGIMGEFMKYLPITLIITLISSLFVALIINPAVASFFLKVRGGSPQASDSVDIHNAGEMPVDMSGYVLSRYKSFIEAALRHRFAVIALSFLSLVVLVQVWLLAVGLEKPVMFFPDIEPESIYVNIDMPEGSDMDYGDRIVKQIEMRINGISGSEINDPSVSSEDLYAKSTAMKPHTRATGAEYKSTSDLENVEFQYSRAMTTVEGGGRFSMTTPNHVGVQYIDLKDRNVSANETTDIIRKRVSDIAGGKITVSEAQHGPPTGAPINIEISGDDFRLLGALAQKVREVIQKVPNVTDVRDDYVEGTPTVRVKVDRQKAALFGLTTNNIGFALKTGYKGLNVSTYREGQEEYDITVQLAENERKQIDVLKELMIPTPSGKLVPLTTIANIGYSGGIGSISHIDQNRVVTVKANVDTTKVPGAVARKQAEELLSSFPIPPGYGMKFTGEEEFQKESESFLSKAFVIALLLIFLILVAQFNSIIQPLIVMTSVVLSLGGAFLGLTVLRSPFGIIMSGVGVISLAGVVVNNAIVLIDYTNKLIARGMPADEAVVSASATRLRPVLLTAITTILGLLPMVIGVSFDFHTMSMSWSSESTQWWQSMAIVVLFGLFLATFLTLVVVPSLLFISITAKQKSKNAIAYITELYWRPFKKQR